MGKPVDHNPLTPQVRERETALDELRTAASECSERIAWHRAFPPDAVARRAKDEAAVAASYETQIADVDAQMASIRKRIDELRSVAKLGWNPTRWLSEERLSAQADLELQLSKLTSVQSKKLSYSSERDRLRASVIAAQDSLERHASFDHAATHARLAEIESKIESKSAEFFALKSREEALSRVLADPVAVLHKVTNEVRELEDTIASAGRLEHELGMASDGYARKMIHEKCENQFGDGSPRKVKVRAEGRLIPKRRAIEKLQRRIDEIIRREAQDIRALIIDGSNLCYEGDRLIGLFALRALCGALPSDIDVTIVFDQSILRKLGLPTQERLRSSLPGLKVYIVMDPVGADETILDLAQESTTFVVSNDHFDEFQEKSPVREERLIRTNTIDGRLLVHDLSIDVDYEDQRKRLRSSPQQ